MKELAERAYFLLCLVLGRLLRGGRYSKVRVVSEDGEQFVQKHRLFYAPLLVFLGGALVRILDTGVRVLSQRDWEERERQLYRVFYRSTIRIAADGSLILPCLAGDTLAVILENPDATEPIRITAIKLAVISLAEFHKQGFTHADAMAENVLVDLVAGVAHWFDFETIHDASRPLPWRRADDVRALLATSLLRTAPERFAETLQLILDTYSEKEVTRLLLASFDSVFRRPLTFHLGQAPLSFENYREIARLMSARFRG